MSYMVAKVADAIEGACRNNDDSHSAFLRMAQAAIKAMRDPTPAMILANSDAGGPDDLATIKDWQAMIDVALNKWERS